MKHAIREEIKSGVTNVMTGLLSRDLTKDITKPYVGKDGDQVTFTYPTQLNLIVRRGYPSGKGIIRL